MGGCAFLIAGGNFFLIDATKGIKNFHFITDHFTSIGEGCVGGGLTTLGGIGILSVTLLAWQVRRHLHSLRIAESTSPQTETISNNNQDNGSTRADSYNAGNNNDETAGTSSFSAGNDGVNNTPPPTRMSEQKPLDNHSIVSSNSSSSSSISDETDESSYSTSDESSTDSSDESEDDYQPTVVSEQKQEVLITTFSLDQINYRLQTWKTYQPLKNGETTYINYVCEALVHYCNDTKNQHSNFSILATNWCEKLHASSVPLATARTIFSHAASQISKTKIANNLRNSSNQYFNTSYISDD